MSAQSLAVLAASGSATTSPWFYVVLAVVAAITVTILRRVYTRRNSRELADAAAAAPGGASDGSDAAVPPYTVLVAPAPPFPETVARLRSLVGEATPEPRITRYTRPIVVADAQALTITDRKIGPFLTIPAADIVAIGSGPARIKPRGTFMARTFPSVQVTIQRGDGREQFALTPIEGAYDKISPAQAAAIARELAGRLGLTAS